MTLLNWRAHILIGTVALSVALPSWRVGAATIRLKNGNSFQGTVVKEEQDTIWIEMEGGQVAFQKAEIAHIERAIPETVVTGPIPTDPQTLLAAIKERYYNLNRLNVRAIDFVIESSVVNTMVEDLVAKGQPDAAKQLENMKVRGTWSLSDQVVTWKVENQPTVFESGYIENVVEGVKALVDGVLPIWNAHVTAANFRSDFGTPHSATVDGDEIGLRSMGEAGQYEVWRFDSQYRERSFRIETPQKVMSATPTFTVVDGRYLLHSHRAHQDKPPATISFTMTYQVVDGIHVPALVDYQMKIPERDELNVEFKLTDVRIQFAQ